MLVLSRKYSESIMIGDNIRVTIVKIRSDGVISLGFEAPEDVKILRQEIFDKQEENNDTNKKRAK